MTDPTAASVELVRGRCDSSDGVAEPITKPREQSKDMSPEAKKQRKMEELLGIAPPMSSFSQLFRFATPLDIIFMVLGLLMATAAGASMPLLNIIASAIFHFVRTSCTSGRCEHSQLYSIP